MIEEHFGKVSGQDDPAKKPRSLQADFTQLSAAVGAALEGRQLQPILR